MPSFPKAPKKTLIPSFAAYPIGYEAIRIALEPHLPSEEFNFGFYGLDSRFAKNRDFSPIRIFRLDYSPGKWRERHWTFYAYGALREDKAAIQEVMLKSGFQSLIEFLTWQREPLWTQLAFSRSLTWDSTAQSLSSEDHNQIDGKQPEQSLASLTPRSTAR